MEYIDFPLRDGSTYSVTFREAKIWETSYPHLTESEIAQEFLKMQRWLYSNPKRNKTRSGMMRFICNWLNRVSLRQQVSYKVRMEAQVGSQRFLGQ